MRHLLLLALIASCGSPDTVRPPPGAEPEPADGLAMPAVDPAASMPLTLRAKFEPVEDDELSVVSPTTPDADGPFLGNDLGAEDHEFLDGQLAAMADTGNLFACFELEDGLFVLRGPGAAQPTDLFLAQWEGGARMLTWIADLAYTHCDTEECSGQLSWLVDLDGDGRRDIVQRSWRQDLASAEEEDRLDAWLVRADGALTATQLTREQRARYRQ